MCRAREVVDTEKISIDYKKIDRIIKEILRCNICLQIYHDPVNIKSCLHKFCKKCIEDYNRRMYFLSNFNQFRKKECALCRHPIETRRLMKEDYKLKEISRYLNIYY
jgi:E3 ubiquitin-protein ligase RNF1/2